VGGAGNNDEEAGRTVDRTEFIVRLRGGEGLSEGIRSVDSPDGGLDITNPFLKDSISV